VKQDIRLGGIWWPTGFIPEAVYQANPHPISVMIWGAICTGVRLPLLKCPERVNAESYMKMIDDSMIFSRLIHVLGPKRFIWQEDDAAPASDVIPQRLTVLSEPPHSPDLSPIEMIWAIIQRKLKGQRFTPEADLSTTLEAE
jgi:hypothetical protein